jgi:hypothetical protein
MRVSGFLGKVIVAAAMLVGLAATASAQSAITGIVKDESGAVLPGVTVEAASDVLIERVKSVVSDGSGVYRITDLRPGVYSVTFTLPGFQTFRRDALNLPAEFTMTINGEMKVGSLEETITVSGDAPVVDVSTAVHTQVLNREAIDAIPTGRTIQGLGQLVVGVSLNLPDTGGARAMQQTYMSAHGMTAANNTVMVDGMIVNGLQSDGAVQSYFNDAMNQEVSYQTSGINAETSSGGVRLNMIPREGGNTFSGAVGASYRPGAWQGSNLTDRHEAFGLQSGNATDRIIDYTFSTGGPIKKDKLWFFGAARYFSVNNFIANTVDDNGDQGIDDQFIASALLRLTWQITPKLKLGAYQDEINKYRGHDMQSNWDPETAAGQWFSPAYHTNQAKLSYTATSRLLLEGGFSSNLEYYTNSPQDGTDFLRGTPEWFNNTFQHEADLGGAKRTMGLTCASPTTCTPYTTQSPSRYNWQAAASYVTGSHNIKAGVQYQRGRFLHSQKTNGDLQQIYRSASTGVPFSVPSQVILLNTSGQQYGERLNYDIGIFGQDSWTMNRLTVNVGLRWEALNASVIGGTQPANRWVPEVDFAEVKDVPKWKDIAPRFSSVYDVFGNSKTALKYSFNRYNQARTTGIAEAYNGQRLTRTALAWTDLNKDDVAQGSLNYNNGVRTACTFGTAGCEINFATLPANFGLASENVYGGFPRIYNLEHALELQHELFPRMSVTGSWFHGNFKDLTATVNENLRYEGTDQSQNPYYTVSSVFDPRTGQPITAYARKAAFASVATKNVDFVDNSDNRGIFYDAFNFEFRIRPGRGSQVFGGFAFERQLTVNCTTAFDDPNEYRFCDDRDNDIPFGKQFKIAGSYPLAYGIQLSGSFQSNDSPSSTRTMLATRSTNPASASRYPTDCPSPCPAGAVILDPTVFFQTSVTTPLEAASGTRVERINQLDIKVQKNFKVNRFTISPVLEIFNLNNSDAIISYVSTNYLTRNLTNQAAGGYLKPNSIMQPRMIGVGAQVKW